MLTLIVFLSILNIALSTCPDELELVRDGQCRGLYTSLKITYNVSTSTAISKCKEIGAQPIIIHTAEQQSYWMARRLNNILTIGLVCNTTSKRWEWADGSKVDYKPPSYLSDLDKDCKTGCNWNLWDTGYWNNACDANMNPTDISCTKQLQQFEPDGCDGFEDDTDDGQCYLIGATAESWQDAQMNCRHLGANLASIHNSQENSFVRRLAVSDGAVNGLFLGATMIGKGTDFGWVDGSAWDYENFHQGFPMAGFGDCLAMDTSISTGLWMNMECAAKLPVACVRDLTEVMAVANCSAGPWVENTIITSPGFPYNASTFCDYFFSVEVGKRVELEIVFLEANSCCDSLVVYDGYLGGSVLQTLTGAVHNVTYTTTSSNIMRVNWQPNGGVNVKGVAMTFRGV